MEKINEILAEIFADEDLIKAVLGDQRRKSLPYKKITIRPVLLKGIMQYQFEYHYEKKVTHENLPPEQAIEICRELLLKDFKQVNIYKVNEDVQVLAARPDRPRILRKPKSGSFVSKVIAPSIDSAEGFDDCCCENKADATAVSRLEHNRRKKYIIPDGEYCAFLVRLGVMDKNGKVFQKHYAKFRQINRYLEIVRDVMEYLPREDRPLKIIDFGCGKAYLTFALYHYLKIMQGIDVDIIGLDLKDDVIAFCGRVAADLKYDGLRFIRGDIADYTADNADMVVTLHACDTATDFALINAVNWRSKVILSVPCCQHELFSQINNELLDPILKHGIIKDRFTELLTDGIRGLALERAGYEVAMVEFTGLEHTSKNIMIKAVRGKISKAKREKAEKEYEALKAAYGIKPTIDGMMA